MKKTIDNIVITTRQDVETFQVASDNTSRGGTTEPLEEFSQVTPPRVKFTQDRYLHSDRTWESKPEEVLSTESDLDDLFVNKNLNSDSD